MTSAAVLGTASVETTVQVATGAANLQEDPTISPVPATSTHALSTLQPELQANLKPKQAFFDRVVAWFVNLIQ